MRGLSLKRKVEDVQEQCQRNVRNKKEVKEEVLGSRRMSGQRNKSMKGDNSVRVTRKWGKKPEHSRPINLQDLVNVKVVNFCELKGGCGGWPDAATMES